MTAIDRQPEAPTRLRQWYHHLQRLLWVALLLVHIAPVTAVTMKLCSAPSLHQFLMLLTLLSIMGLSACKVIDVPWLRISLGRRGWAGFLVLALWIHGDFVAEHLTDVILVESVVTVSAVCIMLTGRLARLMTKWFHELHTLAIQRYWDGLPEFAGFLTSLRYVISLPPRAPPLV